MSTSLTSAGINFPDNTTTTTNLLPSGTRLLFHNSSSPTGWTKDTSINDSALRVVSGTPGSGGSTGFVSALGNPSVSGSVSISGEPGSGNLNTSISGNVNIGSTTLSTAQIPAHSHGVRRFDMARGSDGQNNNTLSKGTGNSNSFLATTNTGSTGSHGHNAAHNLAGSISGAPSRGTLSASLSSSSASINVKYQDFIIAQKD